MAKLRSASERDEELRKVAGLTLNEHRSGFAVSAPPDAAGSIPLAESLKKIQPIDTKLNDSSSPPTDLHCKSIRIDLLLDSPYQPRSTYPESDLIDLSRTLAAVGQQEPIRVRPAENGFFELIEGHRRTRAARLLGWNELLATVEFKSDTETQIAVYTSFDTHKELSEWERAKMYKRALEDQLAKNQAGIANLFGCSTGRVSQVLSTFKLPAAILDIFENHTERITSRIVSTVTQLYIAHPSEEELIARAITRVFTEGAPVESIKSWVEGQIARTKRSKSKMSRTTSFVVNSGGLAVFSVRVNSKGEVLVTQSKDLDIHPEQIQKWIVTGLRAYADKAGGEK